MMEWNIFNVDDLEGWWRLLETAQPLRLWRGLVRPRQSQQILPSLYTAQLRSDQDNAEVEIDMFSIMRFFILSTGKSSPQIRLNKTLGFVTRIDLNSKVQLEHRELFYKYCSILCLCSNRLLNAHFLISWRHTFFYETSFSFLSFWNIFRNWLL